MTASNLPIQRIEIIGLHNDRDISLDFDERIKILVDENGSGKTTFLNLLIGILQVDLQKIERYGFKSVEIVFDKIGKIRFVPYDFGILGSENSELRSKLDNNKSAFKLANFSDSEKEVFRKIGISAQELAEKAHQNKRDEMIRYFPYRILYFPTYRLVEENLHTLGYEKSDLSTRTEQLIQFGMEDIRNRWDRITQEMRDTSIDGFSRINGHMLDELTEEIDPETIHYNKIEDEAVLALVLSRSGDSVTEKSRQRILELVRSGDIRNEKFEPLAYFLSNLITIHESQKDKDDLINNFARVVNGYLRDKEIFYDARALSLQVVGKYDRKPIQLDRLSSGEKQIVSIFSKLYLDFDQEKPFAVFIDEPELSLSMEWQEKLLQDIVDSKHTAFLCAATHSPFIYEGELLDYTDVLNVELTGDQDGGH